MKLVLLKASLFIIGVGAGGYYVAIDAMAPADPVANHTPVKTVKSPIHNDVAGGNLFGRLPKLHQSMEDTIEETSLNISLQGVMTSSIPEQAMAVLLIDGREERAVFVSEEFAPGVKLSEVREEFVVIDRNGQLEKLSFLNKEDIIFKSNALSSPPIPIARPTPDTNPSAPKIKNHVETLPNSNGVHGGMKSDLDKLVISQIEKELSDNGEVALKRQGITSVSNGYRVMKENALLEAAGVMKGDTILSVNGIRASTVVNDSNAIQSIKQSGSAVVLIERNNQRMTLNYSF